MIQINLHPGAAKKAKSGGGFSLDFGAIAAGISARFKDRWMAAAIGCGVVAVAAIAFMYMSQAGASKDLAAREQQGLSDSTRYASVLKDRTHLEAKRDTLLRQLNIIRAIDGDRFVWPHVMEEVSAALPAYTWLTSLALTGTPQGSNLAAAPVPPGGAKKERKLVTAIPLDTVHVRLDGRTVDIQAITRYMSDLEASPFFGDVNLDRSEAKSENGIQVTDFTLTMLYTRPDSTVIRRVPLNVSVK
ncbi:MAG TPA: PilN domain-containing protein [Gemmatimonadaceae bacterium]|jgi:Tfp pilus assembly protein PilN|nr:PilN domain-containing protein [Gemmatimonadaceae bacterium]